MIKYKKILIFVSLALILLPTFSLAEVGDIQDLLNKTAGDLGAGYNTDPSVAETGIARIVGTVANIFLSFLGILFVVYTIYAGWLWMTAAGNDEKIMKAKKTLRDGVIGLIIVLSAAAIYFVVREALTLIPAGGGGIDPGS